MSNKKTVVITIRLSEDEIKPLDEAREKLGSNRSEFFRSILLNNFDPKIHDKSNTEKLDKLLFFYNKSSNNLNQLAKTVNTFALLGSLKEKDKILILNRLNKIINLLEEGIKND